MPNCKSLDNHMIKGVWAELRGGAVCGNQSVSRKSLWLEDICGPGFSPPGWVVEERVLLGGHGSDQVPEGTVIITTNNIVVKAIYLCCSSSHWVQKDPATHRWQRKQLPRHWRMQTSL